MSDQNEKYIVFRLKDEYYGVPVSIIGSIERMQKITRVPNTPDFIKGVINLRGVITPIIDLRERFGMETTSYNEHTRMIITHLENMDVGLIVDRANDVIDLSIEAVEPPPEVIGSVKADYIKGVIKHGERLIILLDLEQVLVNDESIEAAPVE